MKIVKETGEWAAVGQPHTPDQPFSETTAPRHEFEHALMIGEMGYWELVLDDRQLIASAALDRLWGFESSGPRPLATYLEQILPADLPVVSAIFHDPPPQFRFEMRIRPRNAPNESGTVWLAVQGEKRQLNADGPTRLVGTVCDISNLKHSEALLHNQALELEARVRELNCLYSVSRLVQRYDDLETLLRQAIDIVPQGFRQPKAVGVRLVWQQTVIESPGFRASRHCLSHELLAQGKVVGRLEVHRQPIPHPRRFTSAEKALMQALRKPIGRAIEREEVLAALSDSENRWRTLAEALAEGLVLYDQHGQISAWNRSAEQLLGIPLAKGIFSHYFAGTLLREDTRVFPVAAYPSTITRATGHPCNGVVMGMPRDDGSISWLSINTRALRQPKDTAPYPVVVSFTDITDRKRSEEAIRSEIAAKELERRRLNTVLEALPLAVVIADAEGHVTQVNAAAETLWGEASLCAGRYYEDERIHWADSGMPVKGHEVGLARAIGKGESVMGEEMAIERADGTRRTLLNYALPLRDGNENIAGGVAVSVDISDRKRSESERALLAAIVEASPDAIVSTDMEGKITSWNIGAEHLYGYRADEIVGKSISVLMPTECQDELTTILRAIAKGEGVTYFDSIRLTKDGKRVDVSVAVTPITDAEGRVRGAAKIDRNISERKRMEEQLQHDAFHDRLTGVANRSLFMDRLEHVVARAQRFGEPYAVFIMDMDNFKLINDSFGHQVGDQLLCAFAERIQALLRPVDTLARFGGDEFTLLLEETESKDAVKQIANRILKALEQPFQLGQHEIKVSSSIGVVLDETAGHSADQAVRNADVALYEAKRQGKNQYVVFDARMRGEEVSRMYMESELRLALQQEHLTVQFQPIVDLTNDEPVGCEALVRWRHDVMGRVDPSRFITVAEDTGLITPLGRFVLERACATVGDWLKQPEVPQEFYVSVNVSPKEFYSGDLVPFVGAMLDKYGIQGANLRLEITENVIIQHDQEAAAILGQIQALGVQTCLDDFGTGYSSLSYLQQLPFDVIKVDRSFIQGLAEKQQSREIVRAILGLAQALDMETVAEGAESPEQLAEIRALGFRWGQGFGLFHPMDRSKLWLLLSQHYTAMESSQ
ncbi:sensor domain-containing protein [Marinobacter fonticola]|uniref:sensor domain-containing protein n=1 Tax=Marinobacter fonticola TaxID=2603215 RepID=UPI0011E85490|nr:EAL domain-containing protein [Marinobacter fonticola]